ncbi:unnamed protein product [Pedinophyceae sp. YPF-701]|nr:unnamed protein product [Pedinophyceae sp. YPF-701]
MSKSAREPQAPTPRTRDSNTFSCSESLHGSDISKDVPKRLTFTHGIPLSILPAELRREAAELDVDGSNVLDNHEVAAAIRALVRERRGRKTAQKIAIAAVLLLTLTLSAIFGLVWAVVELTKDVGVDGGVMVDRHSGAPLQTANTEMHASAGGQLVDRSTGNPLRVATSSQEGPLDSALPDEAFAELKTLKVTSPSGATLHVQVQGFARIPRGDSASVIQLITPVGLVVVEGVQLTFETSVATVFESAGFPVTAAGGRRRLQSAFVSGLFNYFLNDALNGAGATSASGATVKVPEVSLPSKYEAETTVYHPCDRLDLDGNPADACKICTSVPAQTVFDEDGNFVGDGSITLANGTVLPPANPPAMQEVCNESPGVTVKNGKRWVAVKSHVVAVGDLVLSARTYAAYPNQTEFELTNNTAALASTWQVVPSAGYEGIHFHCHERDVPSTTDLDRIYSLRVDEATTEALAAPRTGTGFRVKATMVPKADAFADGKVPEGVEEVRLDLLIGGDGTVLEVYNTITEVLVEYSSITELTEDRAGEERAKLEALAAGGSCVNATEPGLPAALQASLPKILDAYATPLKAEEPFWPEGALRDAREAPNAGRSMTQREVAEIFDPLVRARPEYREGLERSRGARRAFEEARTLPDMVEAYRRVLELHEEDGIELAHPHPAAHPALRRLAAGDLDSAVADAAVAAAEGGAGAVRRALGAAAGDDELAEGIAALHESLEDPGTRRMLSCVLSQVDLDFEVFFVRYKLDDCQDYNGDGNPDMVMWITAGAGVLICEGEAGVGFHLESGHHPPVRGSVGCNLANLFPANLLPLPVSDFVANLGKAEVHLMGAQMTVHQSATWRGLTLERAYLRNQAVLTMTALATSKGPSVPFGCNWECPWWMFGGCYPKSTCFRPAWDAGVQTVGEVIITGACPFFHSQYIFWGQPYYYHIHWDGHIKMPSGMYYRRTTTKWRDNFGSGLWGGNFRESWVSLNDGAQWRGWNILDLSFGHVACNNRDDWRMVPPFT